MGSKGRDEWWLGAVAGVELRVDVADVHDLQAEVATAGVAALAGGDHFDEADVEVALVLRTGTAPPDEFDVDEADDVELRRRALARDPVEDRDRKPLSGDEAEVIVVGVVEGAGVAADVAGADAARVARARPGLEVGVGDGRGVVEVEEAPVAGGAAVSAPTVRSAKPMTEAKAKSTGVSARTWT